MLSKRLLAVFLIFALCSFLSLNCSAPQTNKSSVQANEDKPIEKNNAKASTKGISDYKIVYEELKPKYDALKTKAMELNDKVKVLEDENAKLQAMVDSYIENYDLQDKAEKLIGEVRGMEFKWPVVSLVMPDDVAKERQKILGYYTSEDKKIYLRQDAKLRKQWGLRLHESVHALQDQYFHLFSMKQENLNTDEQQALTGLIEGDATFTMVKCMPDNPYVQKIFDRSIFDFTDKEISSDQIQNIYAKRQRSWGYQDGGLFVKYLFEKGGWDLVNSAYKNPPKTTEQVLHPEKYLANELAVIVDLPDVDTFMGHNWKQQESGLIGEYGLQLMFFRCPASIKDSVKATDGWGGDAYVYLKNDSYKDNGLFFMKSEWDTESDAKEFAATYRSFSEYNDDDSSQNYEFTKIIIKTSSDIYQKGWVSSGSFENGYCIIVQFEKNVWVIEAPAEDVAFKAFELIQKEVPELVHYIKNKDKK